MCADRTFKLGQVFADSHELDAVLGIEELADALADEVMILGERHADGHRRRICGAGTRDSN